MHPAIVKSRASAAFDGWVAPAIRAFKYDRERDRAAFLAEQMLPAFLQLGHVDALIPVPLHEKRYQWRGFNQAALLAKCIGGHFGVPVEHGLRRIKLTESQTRSSREDRMANMENAFALNPDWSPDPAKHYVLIDDVYTTGATIGACAGVLEGAGAQIISVLTLAFDMQPRELSLYRAILGARVP